MIRIDHLDIRCYAEAIGDEVRANKFILPDEVINELAAAFEAKHNPKAKIKSRSLHQGRHLHRT